MAGFSDGTLDRALWDCNSECVGNDLVLVLVVVTALGFDFTNGFHDTGNAMATSIATKALEPAHRGRACPGCSTWSARSCR